MAEQKFQFVGPNNSLINIIAQNRDTLIGFLKQNLKEEKPDVLMSLQRGDCGCVLNCKTFDDIPLNDAICKHNHYFILYVDNQVPEVQQMILNPGGKKA
jgi:hypothetical protein